MILFLLNFDFLAKSVMGRVGFELLDLAFLFLRFKTGYFWKGLKV